MAKNAKRLAFQAAFPYTVPILAGFLFLGISYGIYMHALGFPPGYATLMSLVIFAGSMEFVTANLLLGIFDPLGAFLLTLLVNARHLFYGLSMLEPYQQAGTKKWYLIFGMCDESFSINYSAQIPSGIDRGWFMFFVTVLNQIYWVTGATLGSFVGSWLTFPLDGLSFVMIALFVVLFIEQLLKEGGHTSAYVGVGASLVCLFIFGSESFMIPAMIAIVALLLLLHKPLERKKLQ